MPQAGDNVLAVAILLQLTTQKKMLSSMDTCLRLFNIFNRARNILVQNNLGTQGAANGARAASLTGRAPER